MSANDITVDEVQRKAVVRATHNITMKPGSEGRTYSFEMMFTLWMTTDGTKIVRESQFVDSLAAVKFGEEQSRVFPATMQQDTGYGLVRGVV